MTGAAYTKDSMYKMVIKVTDSTPGNANGLDAIPAGAFTSPFKIQLISSFIANRITYAYNNNMCNYYKDASTPITNFDFDLTPSYTDQNLYTFTRDFYGQADLNLKSTSGVARILIRLTNYVFSDDAESTCTTVSEKAVGIARLVNTEFYCSFEDTEKKGLFFNWETEKFPPTNTTIRIKFRVRNSNLPGSTNMQVVLMTRRSPFILGYMALSNAFVCSAANFGTNYPKLFFGPGFDPTIPEYPGLGLFTATESTNAIVTNSIKLMFKVSIDLPDPGTSSYYRIKVKIGGNQYTQIPKSTIYEDFPVMTGYTRTLYTINQVGSKNDEIWIHNVGPVSSLKTYTIGFKIALDGAEFSGGDLKFFGTDAFGAISVYHWDGSTETQVVKKTQPNATQTAFQKITNNDWSNFGTNLPTLVHTLESSQITWAGPTITTTTDLTNLNSANKFGVQVGSSLALFVKANIATANFPALNGPTKQTYLELIVHKGVTVTPRSTAGWTQANAASNTNCAVYDNAGALKTGTNSPWHCVYQLINSGLIGAEYGRIRMAAQTVAQFWPNSENNWAIFGVSIQKANSLYGEDNDTAILDVYINLYGDAMTQDPTIMFSVQPDYTRLDNMIVRRDKGSAADFAATNVDFSNFKDANENGGGTQYLGAELPIFLRVWGILSNIQTFKAQKVVLFFDNLMEPLFEDIDYRYQVGCNTSATGTSYVRAYWFDGMSERTNVSGTFKSYLTRSRLEIVFSSDIISVSDSASGEVSVVCPIKMTTNAATPVFTMAMGTGLSFNGSFSAFTQNLGITIASSGDSIIPVVPSTHRGQESNMKKYRTTAGTSPPGFTFATSTYGQNRIANASAYPLGSTVNSVQMEITGDGSDPRANPSGTNFGAWIFCARWDFMVLSDWSATNNAPNLYNNCVSRIKYQYQLGAPTPSGTKYKKYCLYCTLSTAWTGASSTTSWNLGEIKQMWTNNFMHKWPIGTYSGIAGPHSTYGAWTLSNLHEQPMGVNWPFGPNTTSAITITPSGFGWTAGSYYRGLKIQWTFSITNPVEVNGWILIRTTGTMPFQFKGYSGGTTLSDAGCCVINNVPTASGVSSSFACTAKQTAAAMIEIQLTTKVSAGPVTVSLYGLEGINSTALAAFEVYTTTIGQGGSDTYTLGDGVTSIYIQDKYDSVCGGCKLQASQYQESGANAPLNVLKLPTVVEVSHENNSIDGTQKVPGEFLLKVELGNAKKFFENDKLKLNLSASVVATNPNPSKVFCAIVDVTNKKHILGFELCNPDDMSNVEITASKDTDINSFYVKFTNFFNPITTPTGGNLPMADL